MQRGLKCPDDERELSPSDVKPERLRCPACRGTLVSRAAFRDEDSSLEALFELEEDRGSGAYARVRSCPLCHRAMLPLRLGLPKAWIDSCEACQVLWIEALDQRVIESLRRRAGLDRGLATLSPAERQLLAHEVAEAQGDAARADTRLVRVVRLIRLLLE